MEPIAAPAASGLIYPAWFTVNPRISPLGAYLFLMFLGGGLFERGLFEEGLMKLFDKYRIKSSLPKLLFSMLLQEQSIFKH